MRSELPARFVSLRSGLDASTDHNVDEQEFDDGTALSWEVLSIPAAHSSCAMVFLKGGRKAFYAHIWASKLMAT